MQIRTIKVSALAIALGLFCGSLQAATNDIGAIWFIGDSITQSVADGDSNGSPRKSLYDRLISNGYTFSFTGHSTANVDGLPSTGGTADSNLYHYHSGISGSCIGSNNYSRTDMTAGISGWWNQGRLATTKPNIVLIMLGTNDIDQDDNVADAPNRIKTLVDTILAQVGAGDPTPAIYVAQIPPNTGSSAEGQRVIDFNNALPAIVATLQGEGKDVTLVDHWAAINANSSALMTDALHTNAKGNDVLATQWFHAINDRFGDADPGDVTPAVTFESYATSILSGYTTGWRFSISVPIAITHLGKFNGNGGAFSGGDVALYRHSDGSKITTVAVSDTSPSESNGVVEAYYEAITPITLPAGDYIVAAKSNGEGFQRDGYSITTGRLITWVGGWAMSGDSELPATATGATFNWTDETFGFFGGTFKYTTTIDTNSPTPSPMTFAVAPVATIPNAIEMTATTASDDSPVQYFFTNTISGDVSGWQSSTVWINTGLSASTGYGYKVKARDTSLNETAWSGVSSAVTKSLDISGESSTTTLAYSGQVSTEDLINTGQATLQSASTTATYDGFPGTGINDGDYSNTRADNAFFSDANHFPATATYTLDTSVNKQGYIISSIKSFMGWNESNTPQSQANQTYTIEVSAINSAAYTTLTTVDYTPFTHDNGVSESVVTVSDTILASGVDSIRFTFSDPAGGFGTLVREIDIYGSAMRGALFILR